jgi:IclR family acetate operon transcriptional repressor
MQRFTDKTICSAPLLAKELEKVRSDGFAFCRDEASEGVSALAVPVYNRTGKVIASLGQSFPTYFMDSGKIRIKSRISLSRQKAGNIAESISSGDSL